MLSGLRGNVEVRWPPQLRRDVDHGLKTPIVPRLTFRRSARATVPRTDLVVDHRSTGDASLFDLMASSAHGGASVTTTRGIAMAWPTDTMDRMGMPVNNR